MIFRKWGWYQVLWTGKYFKIKLLRFNGKHPLSLQYHNLRNEFWLFLTGWNAGMWREIPKREVHTFSPNKVSYVLEIQYGEACIEEDIVRLS